MATELSLQQCTDYLLANQDVLKWAEIARRLNMDQKTFWRAVTGNLDARDREVKIPIAKLPELQQIIEELQTIPRKKREST